MNGIVLLDEEQQRALSRRSVQSNHQMLLLSDASRRRIQSDAQTTVSNTSTDPRSIATLGDDALGESSLAAMGSSPRTNFTTQAGTRPIPPPLDTDSIQEDGGVDPWMYEDANASLDETWRGDTEGQDFSMKLVLVGVVVGIAIGVVLQTLKVAPIVTVWISIPCQLFLRALSCVVVPYVFCSVAVAIGDIVYVGKISIVGYQTAKIFVTFWLVTAVMGMSVALLFRPLFNDTHRAAPEAVALATFTCTNQQFLTTLTNGSVACTSDRNTTGLPTTFVITDVSKTFAVKTPSATTSSQQSLDEMLRTVIEYVVTPNLLTSFIKSELLSVIVAAMVLGSIAGRNYFNKTRRVNYLYLTLLQTRNALFQMMEWTIALTPVALLSFFGSFIGSSVAKFDSINVFYYVLAAFSAAVVQMLILVPAIVFFMTQCNPYNHMKQMTRAYLFAFACSSSVAAMPVSLACVKRARTCSQSLSNFVVSIGACSNTSAAGFYVPIAVMFLAETSVEDVELTPMKFAGLFALSLVCCVSTPPIPGAGLGIVSAVYTALFSKGEMPPSFMSIVAVEFIVERICTICNVNDDLMAVKIIAENTDETVVQEYLGERM